MKEANINRVNYYLILLVGILYILTVLKYSVNMPYWDDYNAVIGFLNNYVEILGFWPTIDLILSHHNEHRIVFSRIVELVQFKLIGEVNFLYLIIIGNLGWFLVLAFLWKYASQRGVTTTQFLPVVLFMLSFNHYELMTWAMASISQYYQVLFSIVAIYFLVTNKTIFALLFLIVSVFTVGGGVVLIPLFSLYFLLKRDWKNLGLTIGVSILVLLTYFVFLDYTKPGHHPSITETLLNPALLIAYVLSFIGSTLLTFMSGDAIYRYAVVFFGVFFLVLYAFIAKRLYKNQPFLFWLILFIIATATLTGLSRAGFGVGQALSSRYGIYSVLLLSVIYLAYLLEFRNKKIYFIGLFLGLISFLTWFDKGTDWLQSHQIMLQTSLVFPNETHAENALKKSDELGVFRGWKQVPLPSIINSAQKIEGKNQHCIGFNNQLNTCNDNFTVFGSSEKTSNTLYFSDELQDIVINGWTVDSPNNRSACRVFVCIEGQNCHPLRLRSRQDVVKHFDNQSYLMSGIWGKVPVNNLSYGEHILQIRTMNNSCTGYYETTSVKIIKQKQSEFIKNNHNMSSNNDLVFNKISMPVKDERFLGIRNYNSQKVLFSHVGSDFEVSSEDLLKFASNNALPIHYGFFDSAYSGDNKSDGGCFRIYQNQKSPENLVHDVCLDPRGNPADRGEHQLVLQLHESVENYVFEVIAREGFNGNWGWSYWRF